MAAKNRLLPYRDFGFARWLVDGAGLQQGIGGDRKALRKLGALSDYGLALAGFPHETGQAHVPAAQRAVAVNTRAPWAA